MDKKRLEKQIKNDLLFIKVSAITYTVPFLMFIAEKRYFRAFLLFIIYLFFLVYKIKKIREAKEAIRIIKIFEVIILEEVKKEN